MRILALGAHADDVELGCGGSLLRWAAEGHEIVVYVATDSAYAAPNGRPVRTAKAAAREAEASARRLGAQLAIGSFRALELTFAEPLNTALAALFEEVRPDLALVHHSADTHPDHRALSLATSHASRRCHRLLGYASNWYVSPDVFDPRMSVDISATLEEKLALIELFESENGRTGGVWQEHARALAAVQGRRCGVRYAEAFQVVKYCL